MWAVGREGLAAVGSYRLADANQTITRSLPILQANLSATGLAGWCSSSLPIYVGQPQAAPGICGWRREHNGIGSALGPRGLRKLMYADEAASPEVVANHGGRPTCIHCTRGGT